MMDTPGAEHNIILIIVVYAVCSTSCNRRECAPNITAPACGFWIIKIFSVLFFFKPDRQTAPVLAPLRKTRTEKSEKNFSIFQFSGS
ncbi:hypothetical protein L8P23_04725 [Enterobacter roggenkampii]|uniref:hypothetical protein n=2 Tax=Enterobacteriaceae TaxID=543 RepID=UPI002004E98C|nr:hypothetical protein [Enterobacter roggenkampii]ELS5726624.1 hypothetical protein [Enterobacter roggenkampii]MCK7231432.1 hypothetical protein [Enterobacter roggenkampii]